MRKVAWMAPTASVSSRSHALAGSGLHLRMEGDAHLQIVVVVLYGWLPLVSFVLLSPAIASSRRRLARDLSTRQPCDGPMSFGPTSGETHSAFTPFQYTGSSHGSARGQSLNSPPKRVAQRAVANTGLTVH